MAATAGSSNPVSTAPGDQAHITVRNLTMAYGSFVLMRDLNFTVKRGDIFIIMSASAPAAAPRPPARGPDRLCAPRRSAA
jgi:hypothetical protein